MFIAATTANDLPEGLLSSLCYVESRHRVEAVHQDDGSSSSLGVCQIKLNTARLLGFKGTETDLLKTGVNIKYAAKYLGKQYRRYDGDVIKAVAAYNAGSYRHKNGMPINNQYVKKVLTLWLKKVN